MMKLIQGDAYNDHKKILSQCLLNAMINIKSIWERVGIIYTQVLLTLQGS